MPTLPSGHLIERSGWFIGALFASLLLAQIALGSDGSSDGPVDPSRPWAMQQKAAGELPPELADIGITEKVGNQLDLNLEFTNEAGQKVKLGQYFDGKRPVLISPVYFDCPGLCNFHLNGVAEVLQKMDWQLGQQFDMIVFSIDSKEGPELAQGKKENYLKSLNRPGAEKGWHFLVGTAASVKALTEQLGFNYKWDDVSKQWAHAAATHVITPDGKINRYLYGISFDPKTVRLSLVEASEGKAGTVIDQLILQCFQYNPDKRGYAFYAYNILRVGAGIAAVIMAAIFIPIWTRERRKSKSQGVVS